MRCPVCNAIMNNGVCPECGMRAKSDKYEPIEYDVSLKRTGINSKNNNYYKNEKVQNPYDSYKRHANNSRKSRSQQHSKPASLVAILISVFVLGSGLYRTVKSNNKYFQGADDYDDSYSYQSEYDNSKWDVDKKFNTVQEASQVWKSFSDGDVIKIGENLYVFNGNLGVMLNYNNNKSFIYKSSTYTISQGKYYYNPDLKVYFDSLYNITYQAPTQFITLR